MLSAGSISPEERRGANDKRVEQHADLARLCGGAAIPLALFTQWTGAATLDASTRDHAQASLGFSAVLMWDQLLVSRAPKRSIGLERKILARKATRFPCGTRVWWAIARGGSGT